MSDDVIKFFKSKTLAIVLSIAVGAGSVGAVWAATSSRISNTEKVLTDHIILSNQQYMEFIHLKDIVLELRVEARNQTKLLEEIRVEVRRGPR